jgi:hypothetical protein
MDGTVAFEEGAISEGRQIVKISLRSWEGRGRYINQVTKMGEGGKILLRA